MSVRQLKPSFQGLCCSHQSYRSSCLEVWWSHGQHLSGCDCILGQRLPEERVVESNYIKEKKIKKEPSGRKYLNGAQRQEGQYQVEGAQSNVTADL